MNLLYRNIVENADALLTRVNCSIGAAVQPITTAHLQAARTLGGDAIDLNPERGSFVSKWSPHLSLLICKDRSL